jgi:hemerythrin
VTLWNPRLETGIPEIDQQHKQIFSRFDRLVRDMVDQRGAEAAAEILRYLPEYTERHFATEEKLMLAWEYPDIETHRKQHEEFRQTLAEMARAFSATPGKLTYAHHIQRTLVDWLHNHILEHDLRMVRYVAAKKAA